MGLVVESSRYDWGSSLYAPGGSPRSRRPDLIKHIEHARATALRKKGIREVFIGECVRVRLGLRGLIVASYPLRVVALAPPG